MDAIEALNGVTTTPVHSLIAMRGGVIEIVAAGALHKVAASCCHIAKLRGCASKNRLREQRIFLANKDMRREVAVSHHRSNEQTAIRKLMDL